MIAKEASCEACGNARLGSDRGLAAATSRGVPAARAIPRRGDHRSAAPGGGCTESQQDGKNDIFHCNFLLNQGRLGHLRVSAANRRPGSLNRDLEMGKQGRSLARPRACAAILLIPPLVVIARSDSDAAILSIPRLGIASSLSLLAMTTVLMPACHQSELLKPQRIPGMTMV